MLVLWLLAIVLVVRVSVSLSARTTGLIDDETLIDLDDAEPATLDPGLDITGQIARQDDDVPAETGQ